jgi:hypothetical protein
MSIGPTAGHYVDKELGRRRRMNRVRFISWWMMMLFMTFLSTVLLVGNIRSPGHIEQLGIAVGGYVLALFILPWASGITRVYQREYKKIVVATLLLAGIPAVIVAMLM